MARRNTYNLIIPAGMKPRPKIHEETAAEILASHFKSDVYFIEAGTLNSADVLIGGVAWEIKSPIGNSANNIQKNMREASAQSKNIVIDLRRSRLHQTRAIGYVAQFVSKYAKLKRVIIITKTKQILTIK